MASTKSSTLVHCPVSAPGLSRLGCSRWRGLLLDRAIPGPCGCAPGAASRLEPPSLPRLERLPGPPTGCKYPMPPRASARPSHSLALSPCRDPLRGLGAGTAAGRSRLQEVVNQGVQRCRRPPPAHPCRRRRRHLRQHRRRSSHTSESCIASGVLSRISAGQPVRLAKPRKPGAHLAESRLHLATGRCNIDQAAAMLADCALACQSAIARWPVGHVRRPSRACHPRWCARQRPSVDAHVAAWTADLSLYRPRPSRSIDLASRANFRT